MNALLCLLALLLSANAALAQAASPILNATSRTVDIRDGDRLLKAAWVIDPAVDLDVYEPRRSNAGKRVTFISDIDSLSFDVEPGNTYDFLIVLYDVDTCRTRISTKKQSYRRSGPAGADGDTIPFVMRDGRIHVTASVNGSKPLWLMFDTGASILCLRPSAAGKGAKVTLDGASVNAAFGGTATQKLSGDNRLEIAGLTWDHEALLSLEKQAGDSSDGILGYNAFEDKVVEIDYDRNVMVVRDAPPASLDGYARLPMGFERGLFSIETRFNTGQKVDSGRFIIDTGATAGLQVRQDFAKEHGLYGTMKKIGSSVSRGVGRSSVRNEIVRLPELAFGPFALRDVPIHLEEPTDEASVSSGSLLGMDVLKRFNTILDYPANVAYLKPNAHFDKRFKKRSGTSAAAWIAALAALVAVFAGMAGRREKNAGPKGQSQ
jgi:predicted aspartyl protease